jgi:RES domain-containing protein
VSLTAWRICKKSHSKTAFDGEGARRFGGRWNNPGTTVVYVAESQSLAALEMLVHLHSADLLGKYVLIPVEIEESLIVEVNRSQLSKNWRSDPAPAAAKNIGDDWVQSATSVALRVPSTLVPGESNFLLNPKHQDFSKLRMGEPVGFQFDGRLRSGGVGADKEQIPPAGRNDKGYSLTNNPTGKSLKTSATATNPSRSSIVFPP